MRTTLMQIICLISLYLKLIESNNEFYVRNKTAEIFSDLPTHKDLWNYLHALNLAVQFRSQNKNELNLNSALGLLLVNVNLRPFARNDVLPQVLLDHFNKILTKNDYALERFKLSLIKHNSSGPMTGNKALRLFNERSWENILEKFNFKLLDTGIKYPTVYTQWNTYQYDVLENMAGFVPNPQLSDYCISQILSNRTEKVSEYPKRCPVSIPLECYFPQILGNNYGYGLAHRLLFLQIAQTQGCIIFSSQIDKYVRHSYCGMMYMEIEFIANNGFKINDLMIELITLCSLEGHGQFIRRSWIAEIMRSITPSGIFTVRLPTKLLNEVGDMELAEEHVTAVASAALASSIRFILENY